MLSAEKIREIQGNILDAGCVIEKNSRIQASRTGDFLYQIGSLEKKLLKTQVNTLGNFFSNYWFSLLNESIKGQTVKQWLNISNEELDLMIKTHDVNRPWTYYFGLDLTGKQRQITDLNSDRSSFIGFLEEFMTVFKKFYPDAEFHDFYDSFLDLIGQITNRSFPKVFILIEKNDKFTIPLSRFAQKFNFDIGDISHFNERKYDIVLRQLKTEYILENKSKFKKLFRFLEKGNPIINPLGSYISGHKGWLTLISAFEIMPDEWFPASWLVNGKSVLSSDGEEIDIDTFTRNITDMKQQNVRKNYVIKRGLGSGGRGVHIGQDLKKYQWLEIIDSLKNSNDTWVVERMAKNIHKKIKVLDWDGYVPLPKKVKAINTKLNLLLRIYSHYPFSNYSAEVFGTTSNKVNASGYTFPVNFS